MPRVSLIDTNVVSERRKQARANPGVCQFLDSVAQAGRPIYPFVPYAFPVSGIWTTAARSCK